MRMKPCLTSADVKKIMAAALAEAQRNAWAVTVAIVDDGGFMLALERMDGAAVTTAEVAVGKAKTAALTKRPSKFFEDRVKERPAFIAFPAGLFIQGALPILQDGDCVGASASPGCSRSRTSRSPAPASRRWADQGGPAA